MPIKMNELLSRIGVDEDKRTLKYATTRSIDARSLGPASSVLFPRLKK